MSLEEISKVIHNYRKEKGLTQDEVAEISGVSKSTLFRVDKYKLEKNISIDKVQSIANAVDLELCVKEKSEASSIDHD